MSKVKRQGKYYRLTQEDFIEKAIQNQIVPLDLSGFVYKTQHDKYELTCLKHNITYMQKGQAILLGSVGCQECLKASKSKNASSNLSEFIDKFVVKFPEKLFDFSKSVYIKANKHIEVVCDKGHKFSVKPNNLMSGHGCPECHRIKLGFLFSTGRDGYIAKFKEIHRDRYDYSTVGEFKNCKQKVDVTCYEHGIFKITPDNHVQGKGCPLCGKSGYQPQRSGIFYILKVSDNVIKFGITNDIERRLKELSKRNSYNLEVLYKFEFDDGYIAQTIESEVYRDSSIIRNVVSKADMPSGYVETTYYSNLSKILDIVYKYKPT
jgi:hypothetical protein